MKSITSMSVQQFIITALMSAAPGSYGTGLKFLLESKDPFLLYYIIVTLATAVLFFLVLKFSDHQSRKKSFLILVVSLSTLISFTVLWRYIQLYYYLKDTPNTLSSPMGLEFVAETYMPYFLLLSGWVLVIVGIIILYTVNKNNYSNMNYFLGVFTGMLIFLALCRIIWEIIDRNALIELHAAQKSDIIISIFDLKILDSVLYLETLVIVT